jgi:hypothetical protein
MSDTPTDAINRRLLPLLDLVTEARAELAVWSHETADAIPTLRYWAEQNGLTARTYRHVPGSGLAMEVVEVLPHGEYGPCIRFYRHLHKEAA